MEDTNSLYYLDTGLVACRLYSLLNVFTFLYLLQILLFPRPHLPSHLRYLAMWRR